MIINNKDWTTTYFARKLTNCLPVRNIQSSPDIRAVSNTPIRMEGTRKRRAGWACRMKFRERNVAVKPTTYPASECAMISLKLNKDKFETKQRSSPKHPTR